MAYKKHKKKISKEDYRAKNKKIVKVATSSEPTLEKKKNDPSKLKALLEERKIVNDNSVSDKIQSFISILFTVIIFIALILLIWVLYTTYMKEKKSCDKDLLCTPLIKEDIRINEEEITNFIKELRAIIYNLDTLNSSLSKEEIQYLITYFIWGSDKEYQLCEGEEYCLVTKKEMEKEKVNEFFQNYFNIKDLNYDFFTNQFTDEDRIRLYMKDDKIILTFSEFSYETYKHEIVDISSDSQNIKVIFALSEKIMDTDYYNYVGSKTILLNYTDNRLILEEIKTSLK